jgi:hypothetical protein
VPYAEPLRGDPHYPGATVAAQRSSKRRSRKRRNPGSAPRAVPSQRRERIAEREWTATRERRQTNNSLKAYGERPPSPFGGLPVSEVAILVGVIAVIVGLINHGGPALIVGVVVCTLGVLEFTGREHFSGYRSHTTLLAAIPAVGVEVAIAAIVGTPRHRLLLLLVIVPVYAVLFWALRRRFLVARQARVARGAPPRT